MPLAVHLAPHPDDELLGAPAMLMALRDAGWRIVNVACGFGRPEQETRRRAEAEEACRRAGFELVAGQPEDALVLEPDLVAGPSPDDAHPAHQAVARALVEAVERRGTVTHVLLWSLWSDLPSPNVLHGFGEERLAEIQHALAAHEGELARNRYDRLVRARAEMNAVLGPERVFGFGSPGIAEPFAEVATAMTFDPTTASWQRAAPHVFAGRYK